jgi:hypothetical protein
MRKETLVVWIFPILTSAISFLILFSVKVERPVTGLVVGLIVGTVIGFFTKLIYDDCHKLNKIKGFNKYGMDYIKSFGELLKIPYYFLCIWVTPLIMYFERYIKYFILFWGIILIIYLLVRSIFKGF